MESRVDKIMKKFFKKPTNLILLLIGLNIIIVFLLFVYKFANIQNKKNVQRYPKSTFQKDN